MKKSIIISVFSFLFIININSVRIISLGDIVNWCIEADLILTGGIIKLDRIYYDTIISKSGNWYEECANGREKYKIEIDFVIKGVYEFDTLTVYTPKTCLHHTTYQKQPDKITMVMDFYDNSWFKLKEGDKKIIILRRINEIHEVLYSMEIEKGNLDLIDSVKVKGKDYLMIGPIIEKK